MKQIASIFCNVSFARQYIYIYIYSLCDNWTLQDEHVHACLFVYLLFNVTFNNISVIYLQLYICRMDKLYIKLDSNNIIIIINTIP